MMTRSTVKYIWLFCGSVVYCNESFIRPGLKWETLKVWVKMQCLHFIFKIIFIHLNDIQGSTQRIFSLNPINCESLRFIHRNCTIFERVKPLTSIHCVIKRRTMPKSSHYNKLNPWRCIEFTAVETALSVDFYGVVMHHPVQWTLLYHLTPQIQSKWK